MFDRALALLNIVAAIAVAAVCAVALADILSRNILHVPIRGAFDLSELFLVVAVFLGLPEVFGRQRNIVVDVIDHVVSPAALKMLIRLSAAISIFFLLLLIYAMSGPSLDSVHYPEHKQETGIPTWAFWIPMIFGTVLSFVAAFVAWRRMRSRQQDHEF